MRTIIIISIFLSFISEKGVFSQEVGKNILIWEENSKLSWDDFLGDKKLIDIGSQKVKAISATNIKFSINGGCESPIIYAYFDRDLSWKVDTSQALLMHEQLHFDISGYCAKLLSQEVESLCRKGCSDVSLFKQAYMNIMEIGEELHRQYDIDTKHGVDVDKQNYWNKKVERLLNEVRRVPSD